MKEYNIESRKIEELISDKYKNELLRERFPSESNYIHKYRVDNFRPVIQSCFDKVVNTLSKIDSAELRISFVDAPNILPTPKEYVDNIRPFIFGPLIELMLRDPNAVLLVDYDPEPYLKVIRSCNIESKEPLIYKEDKLTYIVTDELISVYDDKKLVSEKPVNGRIWFDIGLSLSENGVYRSEISFAVPFWKEALVMFSDIQGANKNAAYPEKWEFADDAEGDRTQNEHVYDQNNVANSVYATKVIRPTMSDITQSPIPPFGYVDKPIESLRYMNEYYEKMIVSGFKAINMDFLAQVPANTSGISKAYDRSELNGFIGKIARHLGSLYKSVVKTMLRMKYPQLEDKFITPSVHIPDQFDVVSTDVLQAEIASAKSNGVSQAVIDEMQLSLAKSKYKDDAISATIIELMLILDPIPGASIADTLSLANSGLVSREEARVHLNIRSYVEKALMDEAFLSLSVDQKRQKLIEYATI